ncbi:MAG: rhodanese-like domain-containing protein [Clostridia bacterium]
MFESIKNILFGESKNTNTNSSPFSIFSNSRSSNNRCAYKLVSFEQARDMIENEQVILIDVRTKSEYDLMHIKNAINIPVTQIEQKIFPIEQTKPIMVYCSSGSRSKNAIMILNSLGYTNIYIWEYGALANFPYKNMLVYGENGKIV